MDPVRFLLCIHNHQPVGNFDYVIEDAYARAYLPFLDVLEQHPTISWALHNSGCFWEWLEKNHPEYIDRIGKGVELGQIELLAGGFYEPILPALTPEDRRGQVEKLRRYLKERFGINARGLWLTERVWEPDLPVDLVDAGITYLPIDDTQLHQVGVAPDRVRGAFLTESAGRVMRLFPALMSLRYRIPYANAQEVVDFLGNPFPGGGTGLALYADDGEKFGIWPGTHKLVYQERWLDKFLTALEKAVDRVTMTTFAREIEESQPVGLVYLPTGSYVEMGKWSLPADYQETYGRVRDALDAVDLGEEAKLFVRGGFWRNFFARYPESSWMHMRALDGSGRCRAFRSTMQKGVWKETRDHFWRAQCNCAYWHGVFGGLYLPHLRHGIYQEIIRGEALLARSLRGRGAWVGAREVDLDLDGHNEIVLENDTLALYLDPDRGGRLLEWDDRSAAMNLINVLSRRREHYHSQVQEAPGEELPEGGTIHAGIKTKETGLRELMTYDWYDRASLSDHFFDECPDPGRLERGEIHELGDFVNQPYNHELIEGREEVSLRLWRVGGIWRDGQSQALRLEKTVCVKAGERRYTVAYRYRSLAEEPLRVWVAVENHFNLLAANAPDRFLVINGRKARPAILGAEGTGRSVEWIALVDDWQGWHVRVVPEKPVDYCRYPVRTVSLSESGAESNDQGLALLLLFPLELGQGEETTFGLSFSVHNGRPALKESRARRATRTGLGERRQLESRRESSGRSKLTQVQG
ncbi:MAG: DUF1926 domain-containing protein [Candidatus Eisenbacteria sp.]|nr:DUF1926 domain-containing protein [Candidatus Eisenbacteria bacterium]